jgi:ABC-type multidrug transport system fused ATPase/permease subunit
MSGAFTSLSSLQVTVATISVVAQRLLDLLGLQEETSGNIPFKPGRLDLKGVCVTRNGRPILRHLTMSVPRGYHVGLVGASGAGKSTLASLLIRLYDPHDGLISIAGVDLRDIALASLRAEVVIVPQDALIFDMSLRDNITLMSPEVANEALSEALTTCGLDDLLARLPEGIQSPLGQRGFRLSGGERQRVCLARAILQTPQVLILDEALSGVDLETEERILRRLRRLFRNRTIITITHRVKSIADLDMIFFMSDGKIVGIEILGQSAVGTGSI